MKAKPSLILALLLALSAGLLVWQSLRSPSDRVLAGKNKIRFQLQWVDQAQFAGFYVAKAKNFYAEEGLDVELVPGAFNVNPITRVVSRDVDIGMATGDQVLQRYEDGMPLVAVGTVFDRSVACFVTLDSSPVKTAADFPDRKVAVFPSYDTDNLLRVMLRHANIPEDRVKIYAANGNISQLLTGEVDAYGAYLFNEPLAIERHGLKVRVIHPDDKIRFYSDTLITTPEYLRSNRDLVVKFLRASRKGWEYAANNPNEAVDLMFQLNPAMARDGGTLDAQRGMARTIADLLKKSTRPVFTMDESRWRDMAADLISVRRLPDNFARKLSEVCDYTLAEDAK